MPSTAHSTSTKPVISAAACNHIWRTAPKPVAGGRPVGAGAGGANRPGSYEGLRPEPPDMADLLRRCSACFEATEAAPADRPCCRGGSRPQLAFEPALGLLEGAVVGAGGQVFPAAVGDHEGDVGASARLQRLAADADRGVQDGAGAEAREDALLGDQLPGAPDGVVGSDGETRAEHGLVVELRDEALVDVAQAVDQLAVARLGGHDLDSRHLLAQEPACPHEGAG